MQFFGVSITFVALELVAPAQIEKNWIFEKWKNDNFFVISLKKDPNWSSRSHGAIERHQDVKTRHLVCICGENFNIWHLNTFDPLSSLIRQNEIFEFLEKSAFFNEENTNELAILNKSGKIHFFSNWAETTSFWATKVIDTWKNWIFSQF